MSLWPVSSQMGHLIRQQGKVGYPYLPEHGRTHSFRPPMTKNKNISTQHNESSATEQHRRWAMRPQLKTATKTMRLPRWHREETAPFHRRRNRLHPEEWCSPKDELSDHEGWSVRHHKCVPVILHLPKPWIIIYFISVYVNSLGYKFSINNSSSRAIGYLKDKDTG